MRHSSPFLPIWLASLSAAALGTAQDPGGDPRHAGGTPGQDPHIVELVPEAPIQEPQADPASVPEDEIFAEEELLSEDDLEMVPPTPPVAVELVGVPVAEEEAPPAEGGKDEAGRRGGPAPSPHARPGDGPTPYAGGVLTGSDDFFLGHGAGGHYRGAGDTVPPGVAGPSSPGAPAPGSSHPATGGGGGPVAPGSPGPSYPRLKPEHWDGWIDDCLHGYRPRPGETPEAMFFRFYGDNPFVHTGLDAMSTFAADVDTASYALARNFVERGYLPRKEQVRTEEFLNAFAPDVPAPVEQPFLAHFELAPSRFGGAEDRWMLRVSLRGKEIAEEERAPLALVLVVDESGSMDRENRIELVKHGVRMLCGALRPDDLIGIVAFQTTSREVLAPTPVADRVRIESAVHSLQPGGSTNAGSGLERGYAMAAPLADGERTVRVVLFSDGVANTGVTDQDRILDRVAHRREAGIYLNCFGVGMGNHNDVFLERLADGGDGLCAYIDDEREARRRLVDELCRAFVPIARDVKLQAEFDPRWVERWRLLGYENRLLADHEFRDDTVDAGELGSGHQVTALYELDLRPGALEREEPVATLRVRWKPPFGEPNDHRALEASASIRRGQAAPVFRATTMGYRRAVLAAQWAEVLRRSRHARGDSYRELEIECARLARACDDPDVHDLRQLVGRTAELDTWGSPHDPLAVALEEVRYGRYLEACYGRLPVESTRAQLLELERRNQELEHDLRALLRAELESRWRGR